MLRTFLLICLIVNLSCGDDSPRRGLMSLIGKFSPSVNYDDSIDSLDSDQETVETPSYKTSDTENEVYSTTVNPPRMVYNGFPFKSLTNLTMKPGYFGFENMLRPSLSAFMNRSCLVSNPFYNPTGSVNMSFPQMMNMLNYLSNLHQFMNLNRPGFGSLGGNPMNMLNQFGNPLSALMGFPGVFSGSLGMPNILGGMSSAQNFAKYLLQMGLTPAQFFSRLPFMNPNLAMNLMLNGMNGFNGAAINGLNNALQTANRFQTLLNAAPYLQAMMNPSVGLSNMMNGIPGLNSMFNSGLNTLEPSIGSNWQNLFNSFPGFDNLMNRPSLNGQGLFNNGLQSALNAIPGGNGDSTGGGGSISGGAHISGGASVNGYGIGGSSSIAGKAPTISTSTPTIQMKPTETPFNFGFLGRR